MQRSVIVVAIAGLDVAIVVFLIAIENSVVVVAFVAIAGLDVATVVFLIAIENSVVVAIDFLAIAVAMTANVVAAGSLAIGDFELIAAFAIAFEEFVSNAVVEIVVDFVAVVAVAMAELVVAAFEQHFLVSSVGCSRSVLT